MRAVVICPRLPPSPGVAGFGADRRIRLFIEAIAQVCNEVSFLYYVPRQLLSEDISAKYPSEEVWNVAGDSLFFPLASRAETFTNHYLLGMLTAKGGQQFFPFTGAQQVRMLKQVIDSGFDIIFASQLQSMLPLLEIRPATPILFDLDDLVHRVLLRTVFRGPLRPGQIGYLLQVLPILVAELRASRLAARTAVCTEADRNFIQRFGFHERGVVVPNAIGNPERIDPLSDEPALLFLGNYEYYPNLRAAERLITRIWPLIRSECPKAQLLIAGGGVGKLQTALSPRPGVEFLGFVPDLEALYARVRVVCCPIEVGGGTRVKLIEAAGYGRALVSTRVGAEGLEFLDGVEIMLRESDASFAAACIQLLSDFQLCTRLGKAARIKAKLLYEKANVVDRVRLLVEEICIGK